MPTSLRAFALVLLLAGCPSTTDPAPDAPTIDVPAVDAPVTDAPVTDAPATDAPADAPAGDAAASPCGYVDGIDRSCSDDADCLVRLHQTDCCGNSVMIGIAMDALTVYNAGEPACMASYPACECPVGLPTTDSGETVTDTGAVLAGCISRGPRQVCLTYVTMRPADAD